MKLSLRARFSDAGGQAFADREAASDALAMLLEYRHLVEERHDPNGGRPSVIFRWTTVS